MNSKTEKSVTAGIQAGKSLCWTLLGLGALLLGGCGGGGGAAPTPIASTRAPSAPAATLGFAVKQLQFSWPVVNGASSYKLLENPDGASGFSVIQDGITTTNVSKEINVLSHDWANARYIVEACNSLGCTDSSEMNTLGAVLKTVGYLKASNTDASDWFGWALALSGDGRTLAVSARHENSNATGIDGNQADNTASQAGAVYLFRYAISGWSQQAYIKASNSEFSDQFGADVALSADGNTLAVGATGEDSNATGINPAGGQSNNSANIAGAAYVFRYAAGVWSQQAYIKASNAEAGDTFGGTVALSADGNILVVGARNEASGIAGINAPGGEADNSASGAGAVYLFHLASGVWTQQAYIKASNPESNDLFGFSLALSGDGNTLVVGAKNEDSNATGIGGNQSNNSSSNAGAVYLFRFTASSWTQQAYIKGSNTPNSGGGDSFGYALALSDDGNTLAVGAISEDSSATGIGGNQLDNGTIGSGAVYLFRFAASAWMQQVYIKASNPGLLDAFGASLALSSDGNTLVVGAYSEDSNAIGINGLDSDNSASGSGAVYQFRYVGSSWSQTDYVKAANTGTGDNFGGSNISVNTPLALSDDAGTLAVGAHLEAGNATGITSDATTAGVDNSANEAGAVYLY